MTWLSEIFRKFLTKLVLSWLAKFVSYLKELADEKKQKEIDQANLNKYTDAVKRGAPDAEIAKLGQDLLNGIDSSR